MLFRSNVKSVKDSVGAYNDEGPPVPIPNTVVKLIRAEDTWWEAAWENRSMPTQTLLASLGAGSVYLINFVCGIILR